MALLNKIIIVRCLVTVIILINTLNAYSQQETYFYKIQDITYKEHLASNVYKRLDSLEKTRRPNDSYIRIFFNRGVDFGFKHERINLNFNGTFYQVNMLVRNDTICFSSTIFDLNFGGIPYYNRFNKRHSLPKIDTARALSYLKLRNQFYESSKTLDDLETELNMDEVYALRDGDGYLETQMKKHIDTLVMRKDFHELRTMLRSINCETQQYAIRGFDLLKRNKVVIPIKDAEIIDHIKKRNSELESMSGDIGPIIWKAYQQSN
ncbi:MAG: hypothetical protein ACTHJ8_00570 [Mucilaginibacter sp.]